MSTNKSMFRPLAVAALMLAAGSSQAELTVYTSSAAFAAAVVAPGTDTFAGLSVTSATLSPLTRSAGSFSYTATASTSSFYGANTAADPWLSTNIATDDVTFSSFSPAVKAIGGNFFASDVGGGFLAGDVTLTATDSLGATFQQTITGATTSSFLGFVSTGTITKLVLVAVQPTTGVGTWPAADNLTLAAVTAVPEPGVYAMLLAGLGFVGFLARRRQA